MLVQGWSRSTVGRQIQHFIWPPKPARSGSLVRSYSYAQLGMWPKDKIKPKTTVSAVPGMRTQDWSTCVTCRNPCFKTTQDPVNPTQHFEVWPKNKGTQEHGWGKGRYPAKPIDVDTHKHIDPFSSFTSLSRAWCDSKLARDHERMEMKHWLPPCGEH